MQQVSHSDLILQQSTVAPIESTTLHTSACKRAFVAEMMVQACLVGFSGTTEGT